MKTKLLSTAVAALGLLSVLVSLPVRPVAHAQGYSSYPSYPARDFVPPIVFQAAGPTASSIQNTVAAYRTALGGLNTTIPSEPFTSGRREIGWDGGGSLATTVSVNPLADFQSSRGALFTTPDGSGFVQATPDGLASQFNNPTYSAIFTAFSPKRLFSAIGSNITDVSFFVPVAPGGSNIPATVTGFGSVFTDVDQPHGNGIKHGNRKASTLIEYYGTYGELLFSSFVPASQGDGSLSFLGIVFPDARIARVRITSGNVAPGPDDRGNQDVVMMDDFIYGEPQRLP
ncbi:MAG: hypothetical protein ACREEM_06890 [Blastocatellia bacterium]